MVQLAFLVGLAASLVGLSVAAVRGVGLWRQAKRTGAAFTSELASFDARSAHTERLLAEWERSSAELEDALARLHVSRSRLQVLLHALERAQGRFRWLRAFAPLP